MASNYPETLCLNVTSVCAEGRLLRIWGHQDSDTMHYITTFLADNAKHFAVPEYIPTMQSLQIGKICIAKHLDSPFYRARVESVHGNQIKAFFIDLGIIETIPFHCVRVLPDSVPILSIDPVAKDYILAEVMCAGNYWDVNFINLTSALICGNQVPAQVLMTRGNFKFISIEVRTNELLRDFLIARGALQVSLLDQINLLYPQQNLTAFDTPPKVTHSINANNLMTRGDPTLMTSYTQAPPPIYPPSSPALSAAIEYNAVNTRVNRIRAVPPAAVLSPVSVPTSPERNEFRSTVLQLHREYLAKISHVEDGPRQFMVHLQRFEKNLVQIMKEINSSKHLPLSGYPLPGSFCLALNPHNKLLSRAVIVSVYDSTCRTYYVDYGYSEVIAYDDCYIMDRKYLQENIMAFRFSLANIRGLNVTQDVKNTFTNLVLGKSLRLRVAAPEGPPLLQYCDLINEKGEDILTLIKTSLGLEMVTFKTIGKLATNCISDIIVAYVKTCQEFYVQFLKHFDELDRLMAAIQVHCTTARNLPENRIHVGMACCALFEDDEKWYRAEIVEKKNSNSFLVKYVDYGNLELVVLSQLKEISVELAHHLEAQALRCCLTGYENAPVRPQYDEKFEELTLDNKFTMKLLEYKGDLLLVDLIDNYRTTITKRLEEEVTKLSQQPNFNVPSAALPKQSDSGKRQPVVQDLRETLNKKRQVGYSREPRRVESSTESDTRSNPDEMHRGSKSSTHSQQKFDLRQKLTSRNEFKRSPSSDQSDNDGRQKPYERQRKSSSRESEGDNRETGRRNAGFSRDKFSRNKSSEKERDGSWGESKGRTNHRDNREFSAGDNRRRDNNRVVPMSNDTKKDSWGIAQSNRFDDKSSRKSDDDSKPRAAKNSWNDKPSPEKKNLRSQPRSERFEPNDRFSKPRDSFQKFNSNNQKTSDWGGSNKSSVAPEPHYALDNDVYASANFPENAVETVEVTWFYNPQNFYVKANSFAVEFKQMMTDIQKVYKTRDPITEPLPVNAPVIVKFHEDELLYRGVILDTKFNKYRVKFVDYGNTSVVDSKNLWKIEKRFMKLPIQSLSCTLENIYPTSERWADSPDMDNFFNKESYQCVFKQFEDTRRVVELSHNGQMITNMIVDSGLGTSDPSISARAEMLDYLGSIPGISYDLGEQHVEKSLLPGQTIRVFVSFVCSVERFFIILDKSKADLLKTEIEEFMKNKTNEDLTPLTAEQIAIGTKCLIHTNNAWQRSVISEINLSNGVFVEFLDCGGGEELPKEKLFLLPDELSHQDYQSYECAIYGHNVNKPLMTDEQFQTILENKTIIAYIHEVDENRLMTMVYDSATGERISVLEANDDDEANQVAVVCPMPVFFSRTVGVVPHINFIDSMFLQRSCDIDVAAELLLKMYDFYEKEVLFDNAQEDTASEELTEENSSQEHATEVKESVLLNDVVVDQLCAARSLDGNWYRARVVEVQDEGVLVSLIDYGNTELVAKTSVLKLVPAFYEPHELVLHVALPLESIQHDQIVSKMLELIADKVFYVNLAYYEFYWYAEFYDTNISLSQQLIKLRVAKKLDVDPFQRVKMDKPKKELTAQTESTVDENPVDTITFTNRKQIYVTHIDSPSQFYAQLVSDEEAIVSLTDMLAGAIDGLNALKTPEIGGMCAAKYSADDVWYRAEILDADEQITTVRFVDYGNTDVLDNDSGSIKTLPEDMLKIDHFAKKYSLDIKPSDGKSDWDQKAHEMLTAFVQDANCQAEIYHTDETGTTVIDIFNDANESITSQLIAANVAVCVERQVDEQTSNKTAFISHIESHDEFWIQFESYCSDLELISDHLINGDQFPELIETQPGVLCAAKYPEDDSWYRARILSITNGEEGEVNYTVLFIDYGNSSVTSELRQLPEQVLNKRALAFKCSLFWPTDVTLPANADERFCEIAADGQTIFDVDILSSGETSTVKLTVNETGANLIDLLISQNDNNLTSACIPEEAEVTEEEKECEDELEQADIERSVAAVKQLSLNETVSHESDEQMDEITIDEKTEIRVEESEKTEQKTITKETREVETVNQPILDKLREDGSKESSDKVREDVENVENTEDNEIEDKIKPSSDVSTNLDEESEDDKVTTEVEIEKDDETSSNNVTNDGSNEEQISDVESIEKNEVENLEKNVESTVDNDIDACTNTAEH